MTTAEEAIERVRSVLGTAVKSVMVVSDVAAGEVSGVVFDDDEGDYIDAQELVDGATYLVIGLGQLPTAQAAGVAVVE